MNNNEFVLPLTKDLLKYHTRWNERSLKPYTDELFDLWAENGIDGLLDTQLQGPTLTRFGILPDDRRSADRIIGLLPTYKAIFNRSDIQVYRADGHIYIDVPWQTDQVYLGDLLTDSDFEYEMNVSQGIPVAIGMDIYRQSYFADLSRTPHLLVAGRDGRAFCTGSSSASFSLTRRRRSSSTCADSAGASLTATARFPIARSLPIPRRS